MNIGLGTFDLAGNITTAAMIPAGLLQNMDVIVVLGLYRAGFNMLRDMVPNTGGRYVYDLLNATETVGEHLYLKKGLKGV